MHSKCVENFPSSSTSHSTGPHAVYSVNGYGEVERLTSLAPKVNFNVVGSDSTTRDRSVSTVAFKVTIVGVNVSDVVPVRYVASSFGTDHTVVLGTKVDIRFAGCVITER